MRGTLRKPSVAWSRGGWCLAGGATLAAVGIAEAAWTVSLRFGPDLAGLSAPERVAVALWELRPLVFVPFALGGLLLLAALGDATLRLGHRREALAGLLVALCAAHAVFALFVAALAAWVAAVGSIAGTDELTFLYSDTHRVITLVTQVLAYVPLALLFSVIALRASVSPEPEPDPDPEPAGSSPLLVEMEELWSERLAFGPRREQARRLLERLRALEGSAQDAAAEEIAEQLRRLG